MKESSNTQESKADHQTETEGAPLWATFALMLGLAAWGIPGVIVAGLNFSSMFPAGILIVLVMGLVCSPLVAIIGCILGKLILDSIESGESPETGAFRVKVGIGLSATQLVLSVLGGLGWFVYQQGIRTFEGAWNTLFPPSDATLFGGLALIAIVVVGTTIPLSLLWVSYIKRFGEFREATDEEEGSFIYFHNERATKPFRRAEHVIPALSGLCAVAAWGGGLFWALALSDLARPPMYSLPAEWWYLGLGVLLLWGLAGLGTWIGTSGKYVAIGSETIHLPDGTRISTDQVRRYGDQTSKTRLTWSARDKPDNPQWTDVSTCVIEWEDANAVTRQSWWLPEGYFKDDPYGRGASPPSFWAYFDWRIWDPIKVNLFVERSASWPDKRQQPMMLEALENYCTHAEVASVQTIEEGSEYRLADSSES